MERLLGNNAEHVGTCTNCEKEKIIVYTNGKDYLCHDCQQKLNGIFMRASDLVWSKVYERIFN